jgi:hypothetical protein
MANCTGQSIAFLAREFGGVAHAATALGFASVAALQELEPEVVSPNGRGAARLDAGCQSWSAIGPSMTSGFCVSSVERRSRT